MKKKKIGVIAATKFDTSLGISLLRKNGFVAIGFSLSKNPQEQTILQTFSKKKLTQLVITNINKLIYKGVSQIVIYCNSLSGSIDLKKVRQKSHIQVITPLEIYEKLAISYNTIGLIAANCLSCCNIEKLILKKNKKCIVIGYGNLHIVNDVERGLTSKEIIEKHSLNSVVKSIKKGGAQIIIIGCTHFSGIYKPLSKIPKINLFEPSIEIVKKLSSY